MTNNTVSLVAHPRNTTLSPEGAWMVTYTNRRVSEPVRGAGKLGNVSATVLLDVVTGLDEARVIRDEYIRAIRLAGMGGQHPLARQVQLDHSSAESAVSQAEKSKVPDLMEALKVSLDRAKRGGES